MEMQLKQFRDWENHFKVLYFFYLSWVQYASSLFMQKNQYLCTAHHATLRDRSIIFTFIRRYNVCFLIFSFTKKKNKKWKHLQFKRQETGMTCSRIRFALQYYKAILMFTKKPFWSNARRSDRCLHDNVFIYSFLFSRRLLVLQNNKIQLPTYIAFRCKCLQTVKNKTKKK